MIAFTYYIFESHNMHFYTLYFSTNKHIIIIWLLFTPIHMKSWPNIKTDCSKWLSYTPQSDT